MIAFFTIRLMKITFFQKKTSWLQDGNKVVLFMLIESAELKPNRVAFTGACFIDNQFAHVVGELKESCLGTMIEQRFYLLVG